MRKHYLLPLLLMICIVSLQWAMPLRAQTRDLNLTFPTGGEVLPAGSTRTVTWEGYEEHEMEIYLSTDSGRSYDSYLGSSAGGTFSWMVPNIRTERARIQVIGTIQGITRTPLVVEDSSDADFSIMPPPTAPIGLSAVALSSSEVQLQWTDNAEDAEGLIIDRDGKEVGEVPPDEAMFIDRGLAANTTYAYRVRAYNAVGTSPPSNEATTTTLAADAHDPLPPLSEGAVTIRLNVDKTEYYVDEELRNMDAAPMLEESRALLPIRHVAEPLGALVSWNPLTRRVTVVLDEVRVELWIGENQARVNGVARFIDDQNPNVMPTVAPPGRAMLPLRFIAESLGCAVEWDAPTREVTVTYDPDIELPSIADLPKMREDCSENVITFEDFGAGTEIFHQYGSSGVTFPRVPHIVEPDGTHLPSGARALGIHRPGMEFGGKLVIEFTAGQTCVSMFAGLVGDPTENKVLVTLEAFDAGETVIVPGYGMEIYPPKQVAIQQGLIGPGPTDTFRKMTVETEDEPLIHRVELSYQGGYSPVIDDLRFSYVGEAFPEIDSRPRATIETPMDGEVISGFAPHSVTINLTGTVQEAFKLRSLTYTVTREDGMISGALPFSGDVPTYTFAGMNMHGLVLPGENRIRVTPRSWSRLSNVSSPGVANVYYGPLLEDGDEAELLILSPDDFYHALVPLRDWKTATGIPAHIMTLRSIEQDPRFAGSRDVTEQVKRAIAHAYLHHGTRYVMLVGDGDRFPVRYFKTGREDVSWGVIYPITDLYYACLFKPDGTFDDWDGNGNGIIGEWWAPPVDGGMADSFDQLNIDDCSLKPDVALGRIPASTIQEVEAYVAKVIEYEGNASPAYENIVLWNGPSDFRSDHLELDRVIAEIFPDFTPRKHYRPAGFESWESDAQDHYKASWRQQLISDLNQGASFAIYFGHGSRRSMGVLRARDVEGLTNTGRYPVFVASACDTAKFVHEHDIYVDVDGNYPPCWPSCPPAIGDTWPGPNPEPAPIQPAPLDVDSMAEALLLLPEAGAIGFLGARSGTNTASHPFVRLFLDAHNSEQGDRLGNMWMAAVTQFVEQYLETDHWFGRCNLMSRHIHIFVLFGDPSLRIQSP